MTATQVRETAVGRSLQTKQVGIAAAALFALGLLLAFFVPAGPRASAPASPAAAQPGVIPGGPAASGASGQNVAPQGADQQAAPLLEELRRYPENVALLTKVAAIYHVDGQYATAVSYYQRALRIQPQDAGLHTKLASSLYRGGDSDAALDELKQALSDVPTDPDALYDLGMIRLQAKGDGKGALAAWGKLLRTNHGLGPERKARVEELMAGVQISLADQQGTQRSGKP